MGGCEGGREEAEDGGEEEERKKRKRERIEGGAFVESGREAKKKLFKIRRMECEFFHSSHHGRGEREKTERRGEKGYSVKGVLLVLVISRFRLPPAACRSKITSDVRCGIIFLLL